MSDTETSSSPQPETSAQAVIKSAKQDWLERFDGPVLTKRICIGTPMVRSQFLRHFTQVGRNAHMTTVFGRILVSEDKVLEAERILNKKIESVRRKLENKIAVIDVRLAELGIGQDSLASLNQKTELEAKVIVPAQNELLKILVLADLYAQKYLTLWLEGEMPNQDKANEEFVIKNLLRGIASTANTTRVMIQRQLNQSDVETNRKAGEDMAAKMSDVDTAGSDSDVPAEAIAA